MTTPEDARTERVGFVRDPLPTIAALSLKSAHARDDLEWLGWRNTESLRMLWSLSGAGDPDVALNLLVRLYRALEEEGQGLREEFDMALRENTALRIRVLSMLGGSSALGDHLVANPLQWKLLLEDAPTREEMFAEMLASVGAAPARVELAEADQRRDTASDDLSTPGTYRATLIGAEAERELRLTYRSLLMRLAALDLAGSFPADHRREGQPSVPFTVVTRRLSDLADAALTAALSVAIAGVYGEKPVDARLSVIAMGKCGAQELNYISDVDVVFIAEPAHSKSTRLAAEFIRIGCNSFFEVDAALRPEGKSGALVRTLDSHLAYYKRWAETWEFQALLKARPMTGTMELGREYIGALAPLVWSASQRESFVDDVQAMRRRVLDNVPEDMRDRELKLGRGGLRDVEFAVQLLQMVHGRSDETLRVRSTVEALSALVEGGYVGREDGTRLIEAYEFLRLLEHRLQLERLRRTHSLPRADDRMNMRWLARAAGFTASGERSSAKAMEQYLRLVRLQIQSLHSQLFYRPLLNSVVNFSVGAIKLTPEAAKLQLGALGYQHPVRAYEHLTALAAGNSRKAKIQSMLLPTLMEWLSQTADPDAGLLNYRKLSDAAYDRSWFLRMLRDEGVVGQRLMRILGNSPYTAALIIAAPDFIKQLGDGANGPKLLDTAPDQVSKAIQATVSRHSNPDKAISAARSLRRLELARIASADLLNLLSVEEVCRSLSLVWDAVLDAALKAEIRAAVGAGEGPGTAPARISVIGMGRLGGAELGYGSVADVMFVCEPEPGADEGEALRWSIDICDSMRSRLAKPSDDPPLEVDLGLRPEGRSGAVVRTLDSYVQYYQRWGEVWEVQALLRATWIAGDRDLGIRFLEAIDPFRYPENGATEAQIREVRRMKARVDAERLPRGADRNTHTKLGRGALTDIEWTTQLLTMLHAHEIPELHNTSTLAVLDVVEDKRIITPAQAQALREAWLTATRARNALVLVRGKRTDQLPPPGPHLAQVAGASGWDPTEYQEYLENYLRVTRKSRHVVDEVFWGLDTMEP
ncbi:bifunctional [glutamine synthetase] adenylyltransferase/[glutamine synthetase]-adenylyl-L-tyrosine phosphorylase [Corynebacterium pacaense]|uniref:bifunctional [glutamine synthetase] adenylyltransferase/[glutamine synthetase]-adenylyl-L-tyrosine phosphorylase n=1 Tax=Corynebacterium pacaense TaxID=1816684 RepID=UPI0009BAB80F|nr:bifunctional [glutamine synthetase] adenylyltransferase/[glutamine synthetase]-adenylyl-L-tyrosine phosphorylase [Corynebacterium pacaense]